MLKTELQDRETRINAALEQLPKFDACSEDFDTCLGCQSSRYVQDPDVPDEVCVSCRHGVRKENRKPYLYMTDGGCSKWWPANWLINVKRQLEAQNDAEV